MRLESMDLTNARIKAGPDCQASNVSSHIPYHFVMIGEPTETVPDFSFVISARENDRLQPISIVEGDPSAVRVPYCEAWVP
jgi:hypothetical protein